MATADNPKSDNSKPPGNPNPDSKDSDIRNPIGIFTKEQIEDIAKKLDGIGSEVKDYQPLADEIRKAFEQPFSDMINIFQKIENAISSICGINPENALSEISDKSGLSASGENIKDNRHAFADEMVASTTEDGHIIPAAPPITSATAEDELSDLSDTAMEQLDHSEEVEDNERKRHKKLLGAVHDIGKAGLVMDIYNQVFSKVKDFSMSFLKNQANKRLGDKVVGGKKLSEYKLFQMMFGEERDMAEETADNTKAIAEHAENILKKIQGIAGDKQSEHLLKIAEQLSENGMDAHVWFAHIVAAENDILKTIQDNAIDTSDWHSRFLTSQTGIIDAIKEKDLTVNIPPVTETPAEIETAASVKEIDKTTKDILGSIKSSAAQKDQQKKSSDFPEISEIKDINADIKSEARSHTDILTDIRDSSWSIASQNEKSEKAAGKRHQEILKKFSGATSASGSDSPVKRGRKGDKDKQIDKLGKDIKKGAGKGGGKPGAGGGGLGGLFGGGGMMGMAVIGVILAAVVGLVIGKLLDGLMTKILGQSLGGAAFDKLNPNDTTEAHQKRITADTRTAAELKDKDIRDKEVAKTEKEIADLKKQKEEAQASASADPFSGAAVADTSEFDKKLEEKQKHLETLSRIDTKQEKGEIKASTPEQEKVARTRQTDAAVETAIPLKEKKAKGEKLTEPEQQKLADSEKTIREVRATKKKTKLDPAPAVTPPKAAASSASAVSSGGSVGGTKATKTAAGSGGSVKSDDDLRVKGGMKGQAFAGGKTNDATVDLAKSIQGEMGDDLYRFSAFNDQFHKKKPKSTHNLGLALDFSIKDPKKSTEAEDKVKEIAKKAGLSVGKGKDLFVLDEYKHPSPGSSGGHIHVNFGSKQAADKFQAYFKKQKEEGDKPDKEESKEEYVTASATVPLPESVASEISSEEQGKDKDKKGVSAGQSGATPDQQVSAQGKQAVTTEKGQSGQQTKPPVKDTFNSIGSDDSGDTADSPIISAQISESPTSLSRSSSATKPATLTASGKDSTRPIAPAPTIVPAQVENKPSPPVQRIAERPADIAKANAQAKAAGPRVDNSRMENLMKEQNQILAQMQQKKTENPAGDTDQKIPLGFDDPHLQAYAADLHG